MDISGACCHIASHIYLVRRWQLLLTLEKVCFEAENGNWEIIVPAPFSNCG